MACRPTHQQISWNNNSNNFNDSIYPYLHRINRWLNATYIYTFSVGYLLKSHFSMLTNSGHFWWYWMPRYILVQANLNIILNCPDVLRAVGLNYLYQPQISQDKPQSMHFLLLKILWKFYSFPYFLFTTVSSIYLYR